MNREILPKVKLIMNNAMKEAKSFDDIKIRSEHILLSMLIDGDNEVTKILKHLRISAVDVYDNISDHLRKDISTPRLNKNVKQRLPFSDEAKSIIKALDNECEKLNDNTIDITHIMLVILSVKSPTTDILNGLGLTYTQFKDSMEKTRNSTSDTPFEGDVSDKKI